MSRRTLSVGTSLVIAVLFTSAFLLTLAHAAPEQGPIAITASAGHESPSADKTIQGHAKTDEDSPRPVARARVVVKPLLVDEAVAQAETDAGGAYSVTFPAGEGCYRVVAQATDAISPAGVLPPADWQPVCFGWQSVKTVDVVFRAPTSQIVGRIWVSKTTSAPSFPVTVTARSRWSLDHPAVVEVSQALDADGFFTLSVPAATYDVFATPDDPCYFNPDDMVLARGIEVEGRRDLGTHYLSPVVEAATLAGHVRTPGGEGVAGVDVRPVKVDLTDLQNPGALPWPLDTTNGEGAFSFCIPSDLAEGRWWVGVALGHSSDYMPSPLRWWTTVSLTATQVVTDVELLVEPASALISATLIQETSGEPASDACGVVAAFRQGDPTAYNARPFVGGTFQLPVITGTYRLAVIPDPGLPITPAFYPEACAASMGKYLMTTEPRVAAPEPTTVTVPITVRVADATVHGRLWDPTEGMTVTGVSGQLLGWSQGTWSAARLEPETGLGHLRASSGSDWLLAYHVDPTTGYRALPGVTAAAVPSDADEVTVNLPVWDGLASITGTVLQPNGEPLTRPVAVAAVGLAPDPSFSTANGEGLGMGAKPRGDTMVTEDGAFTLTLGYGVYAVSAVGPPEVTSDEAWISPEPQIVALTPGQPSQKQDLQYRRGDAVIHGQVRLPAAAAAGQDGRAGELALVWAAAPGAHTKTWADVDAGGAYTLPVLQGQRWAVGAAYELDRQLWVTQTAVTVAEGTADVALDLRLTPALSLTSGLAQAIDAHLPAYGELADGAAINVPVGALPEGGGTLQLRDSLMRAMARADVSHLAPSLGGTGPASTLAAGDVVLLSPAYELSLVDAMGRAPGAGEMAAPMALTIPYDDEALMAHGLKESDVQAVTMAPGGVGWEAVANVVVDEEANEVVVFTDRMGSYALVAAAPGLPRVFLPLVVTGK
jgi:hypothetical protein